MIATKRRNIEETYRFLSGLSGVVSTASSDARRSYIASLNQAFKTWKYALTGVYADTPGQSSYLTDRKLLAVKLFRAMIKSGDIKS